MSSGRITTAHSMILSAAKDLEEIAIRLENTVPSELPGKIEGIVEELRMRKLKLYRAYDLIHDEILQQSDIDHSKDIIDIILTIVLILIVIALIIYGIKRN